MIGKHLVSIISPLAPNRFDRVQMIAKRLILNKATNPDISFEWIMVDNSPNAQYEPIYHNFYDKLDIKYINVPISYPYPNPSYMRNVGFRVAEGTILTMVDSDWFIGENFVKACSECKESELLSGFVIDSSKGFHSGIAGIQDIDPRHPIAQQIFSFNKWAIDNADSLTIKETFEKANIKPEEPRSVWMWATHRNNIMKINGYDERFCVGGYCFDEKTEVLTKMGFKPIKDIKTGDQVFTLNQSNFTGEWQAVTNRWDYEYKGDMYEVNKRSLSLRVTGNHMIFGAIVTDRSAKKRIDKWELIRIDELPKQLRSNDFFAVLKRELKDSNRTSNNVKLDAKHIDRICKKHITKQYCTEKVYGIEVPNGVVLIKRNGCNVYCGQSKEDDGLFFRLSSFLPINKGHYKELIGTHLFHAQMARGHNQYNTDLLNKTCKPVRNPIQNIGHDWGKPTKDSYSIIEGTKRNFRQHEEWIFNNISDHIYDRPWESFEHMISSLNCGTFKQT